MTTLTVCKFNLVYQLETEARKKVEFFGRIPHFCSSKKFQKPKWKSHFLIPNNTYLLFQNPFLLIGDGCKKLTLKILKEITKLQLSSEKNIFKNSLNFWKVNKNCDYSANFQNVRNFFSTWGFIMWSSHLLLIPL